MASAAGNGEGARRTGPALEAMYRFALWLVPMALATRAREGGRRLCPGMWPGRVSALRVTDTWYRQDEKGPRGKVKRDP